MIPGDAGLRTLRFEKKPSIGLRTVKVSLIFFTTVQRYAVEL